jgi:isoleucyl-tRNA synthetase
MEAIQDQREEFQQLGIMADWSSETETYRTMGMCVDGGSQLGANLYYRPSI